MKLDSIWFSILVFVVVLLVGGLGAFWALGSLLGGMWDAVQHLAVPGV